MVLYQHMNALFLLIKSLKHTEKRYFTLSASSMVASKKNNYLKLFEVLNEQTVYDEDYILKKYRTQPFVKNYAANKAYLYDMILASLRNYQEDSIEEWAIRRNFYKIKILASKGLDMDCERLIIKTKEKAWQYEQYQTLLDILDIELYLFGNCRIGDLNKDLFWNLKSEKDKVIKILSDFNYVHSAWHQINILFSNKLNEPFEEIKKQAERIVSSLQLQNEPNENYSLTLRNRYLACFELFYNNIGDAKKCYEYNKKIIENRQYIDERMPHFAVDAMAVYFNFMVACYKYEKWDEMESYLIKTVNYPINSVEQEIRRIHNFCYNGILLYLHTKQYDKAQEVVDTFIEAKVNFENRYRLDFLLFTQAHCGWYYFLQKDYYKANEWWREILQGPKNNIESRTQATTKLYLLILFYTQRDESLLEYELTNTKRFLKQHFLLEKDEKLFIEAFSKLHFTKADTVIFQNLAVALKKSDAIKTEKSVLNPFIIQWISEQ
jgi:hypothetical protein